MWHNVGIDSFLLDKEKETRSECSWRGDHRCKALNVVNSQTIVGVCAQPASQSVSQTASQIGFRAKGRILWHQAVPAGSSCNDTR